MDALINDLIANRNGDSPGERTPSSSPGTPAQGYTAVHSGPQGFGSGRLSRASNVSDQLSLGTTLIHPNGDHTQLQQERFLALCAYGYDVYGVSL